ncbi:MAG TPA: serine/threonine-protein kinase, partial [Planctomycetota bacterium]|nr:serine/threonine-protein kinase [Planctomycetota bacterium]
MDRQIGGYLLGDKLGEGGMGVVFRAHHPDAPARPVALKLLRRDRATSPDSVERFRREMHALAALSHPNVVRILGGTLEGPTPHYVMELVTGESLETVLARGPLEARRACELVRDVASAIEAAHEAGIIHRDLKPSNVLLDADGRPRICDFGLATADQAERLTRTGVFLGTAAWAAPEQLVGDAHRADERTDVFALGALLWAALAGRGPFDDAIASGHGRILGTSCPTPSSITQGIPRALDAICGRALDEEPRCRYPTARAFREDLERWLRGERTSVESPPRSRASIVFAVVLLAAVGAVVALWPKRAVHEAERPDPLEDLLAAAARKPGEAPKVAALEAAAAAAVAAPDRVVLVGERDGFALGHELLDARDILRVTRNDAGASFEAVALLAAANALAGARLARSPADPAGHALRAYAALAAAGAPRAPLEPGELGGIPEAALSDLEAAGELPGPAGSRAAWLLADLRAARGEDDAARAALERARKRFPDDPSRASLERVLATPVTPEGLASLLREAGEKKTLGSAIVLSRFFARLGAPAACEHPEVAFDARALERVLAAEVPRASSSEYVSLRSPELKEARNTYWNARRRPNGLPVGAPWTTLAPLLRRSVTLGPTDPEVLGD